MKLDFLDLGKLAVSKANMRHAKKAPDIADILPTVRARGVLVPILVRPNGTPDTYEIVAGARRFHAASTVAEERRAAGQDIEPMPCAILETGDDADAVEASLIENTARRDADEVTQWETFARLVREGRNAAELSATFGLPDLAVKRILALGNLMPRIRSLYQREDIDRATVHHLTLASKRQQRAWLALLDDPEAQAPRGHQLKAWLFGGQSIPAKHALFDTEGMAGIVADLFGEDRYFTDPDAFWALQNAAIEARRAAYLAAGWADAVIVPPGAYFHSWEHEKAGKRKGGRVYIDVRASGEVTFHEGYVTAREARRIERGEVASAGQKPARPEITGTMQTYIDLHRHAALRAALTDHPGIALRLMVAHAIAGSPLWGVRIEPQATRNEAIRQSVESCRGETDFDAKRREALALLGCGPDDVTVAGASYGRLDGVLLRLLPLADADVMAILCIVMGETLAAGSGAIEIVGQAIGLDMACYWQADDAFFEALRDREVLTAIVAEVAGETVATANAGEKTKVLKTIIRDRLAGANGRARREDWVPKWLAFPPAAYTARGGVGTVDRAQDITVLRAEAEGRTCDPDAEEERCGGEVGADSDDGSDDATGGVPLAA
jgi:ParB family transcriptional regulator, chromosome partitioning protein